MAQLTKTTGHDGKPRYQTRVYVAGRQHMITARSKSELAAMEKQMREDDARGMLPEHKMRLKAFWDSWLAGVEARRSLATYLDYQRTGDRYILPELGGYQLTELTHSRLQAWVDRLPTPAYQHRCKLVLHACLGVARKRGLLRENPADGLECRDKGPSKAKAWTKEEAAYFLHVAEGQVYWPYWPLALHLPVRPSELRGLRWRHINFDRGTLQIAEGIAVSGNVSYETRGKNAHSARTFDLSPELLDILRRHKRAQNAQRLALGPRWQSDDLVCTTEFGGVIPHRNLQRAFDRLIRIAGVPRIRPYDTRHTAITLLADAGAPIKVVSELAGHSNVQTTQNIYQHTRREQHKAALATLSGLLTVPDDEPVPSAHGASATRG